MSKSKDTRQERLDALLDAMRRGEKFIGTSLTLREIAMFANRVPVNSNVSAVRADLLVLADQGKIRILDIDTRRYKVVEDAEEKEAE